MKTVYRIPESNWVKLNEKLDKLNKKATKLGAVPVILKELSIVDEKDEKGIVWRYYNVEVTGEAPKLKGWSFVAVLVHTPEGNVINKVPGEPDVPEKYRTSLPTCDYCKKDWIVRRDTYLVRNDAGEYKQVGSTCLSDFLGHPDPQGIAMLAQNMMAFQNDLEEAEHDFGMREPEHIDLEHYLAMTAAVIEDRGWVSRKQAFELEGRQSTADVAVVQIIDPTRTRQRVIPTDKHFELAKKAIKYARTELPTDNDYRQNLKVLSASDSFQIKAGAGTIASLIPYYKKEMEYQERKKKTQTQFAQSKYVGEVGDRLYDLYVDVISVRQIPGYMGGITNVHRMLDNEGNLYVWFATSQALESGEDYVIAGTVKAHKEFQGIKETILTRVRTEE